MLDGLEGAGRWGGSRGRRRYTGDERGLLPHRSHGLQEKAAIAIQVGELITGRVAVQAAHGVGDQHGQLVVVPRGACAVALVGGEEDLEHGRGLVLPCSLAGDQVVASHVCRRRSHEVVEPGSEGGHELEQLLVGMAPVGVHERGGDVERLEGDVSLGDARRQPGEGGCQLRHEAPDGRSQRVTGRH